MVKSEHYTCKICKRIYSSASSLCNHTTKFHKNNTYNHNNSISQHKPQHNNSIKMYNCRKCDNTYKHQQSRSRHEKICMNIEIITSFNQRYYDLIGKDCVDTWLKYWPKELTLTCYVEEFRLPEHPRLNKYHLMYSNPNTMNFNQRQINRSRNLPKKPGVLFMPWKIPQQTELYG